MGRTAEAHSTKLAAESSWDPRLLLLLKHSPEIFATIGARTQTSLGIQHQLRCPEFLMT